MSLLKATDSCYSRRRLSTPCSVTQCKIISGRVIAGPGDYFALAVARTLPYSCFVSEDEVMEYALKPCPVFDADCWPLAK